jgi:uncharacterized membrane protein
MTKMSGLKCFMIALCGALCLLILAPPFLAVHSHPVSSALAYFLFSPLCHQIPERSFHLYGHPLAVCHRCTGIYFGLFLGMLLPVTKSWQFNSPLRRRLFVLCMCTPILLDFFLSYFGIWAGAPLIRFATGIIFGSSGAFLLALAFCDYSVENNLKNPFPHCAHPKGANL